MKKALFPLIVVVLVLGLALAPLLAFFTLPVGLVMAQEDDPEVCVLSQDLGLYVWLKDSANNTWLAFVGAFNMTVDGEEFFGWCVDVELPIGIECFNATLSDASRETPWCEIAYIETNYTPYSNHEAAAMQLAIWKYIYGRLEIIATDPGTVETRALQIYDDAEDKSVIGPWLDLTLEWDGETTVVDSVASRNLTATIIDSNCTAGIAVEFSTNKGSFNSSGPPVTSTTVLTDAHGKASVTLYWDASQGSLGATVTAHTEGAWPVIIQPEQGIIQPTKISKHWELTKEITPPPPPPGVPTMNHWGTVAIIALFAGLLMWTVRRRQLA